MEFSSMARFRFCVHLGRNARRKYRFTFAPSFPAESRSNSSSGSVESVPGGSDEASQTQHWKKFSSPSAWRGGRLDKTNPQQPLEFQLKPRSEAIWISSQEQPNLVDSPVGNPKWGPYTPGDVFGKLCEQGQLDEALDFLKLMEENGTSPPVHMYSSLLKVCAKRKVLRQAKRVHAHLAQRGLDKTRFLGEYMVHSLVKCGGLEGAHQVFDGLQDRTVFSWTAMISGYAMSGKGQEALRMYQSMQLEGVLPNAYTFVSLLKACVSIGDLVEGKRIHAQTVMHGCEDDLCVQTCLVDMYGKCGSIVDAHKVFCGLSKRDVVSWTAMLTAYVQQGQAEMALQLYDQMWDECVTPNDHSFATALQACGMLAEKEEAVAAADETFIKVKSLERGKGIHAHAQSMGYDSELFVGSALVSMYGKCGNIVAARAVFDGLSQRNVVTWNVMLVAYAEQGQAEKAVQLYEQMRQEGKTPNNRTFVSALQVCGMLADKEASVVVEGRSTKVKSLERSKALHADAQRMGYCSDVFLGNSLINVYGKCGSITDAQTVFDSLSLRDVVGWTVMLMAYVDHSRAEKALHVYEQMREEGPSPDIHTFMSMLKACTMLGQKQEGVVVNGRCIKLDSLSKGKIIHADAGRKGYVSDVFISNTLVSMYGKCGSIVDAANVFDSLSQPTVVSWNAMLAAYVDAGETEKALQLYEHMLEAGVCSDAWTFVSTLQACGMFAEKEECVVVDEQYTKVKSLEQGKVIHADATQRGYGSDVFVGSALISLYAKCGNPADACNVFDQLPHQDVVSWATMLAMYSDQGEPGRALQLYEKMRKEGISPNDRTIVSALQACGVFAAKEDNVCDGLSVKVKSLQMVKAIHADAWIKCYDLVSLVGSTLITLYGKFGSIVDAEIVFDALSQCDTVAWTTMVTAYKEQGQPEKALQLYGQMQEAGVSPDVQMFVSVLQVCGMLAEKEEDVSVDEQFIKVNALKIGRTIHADAQRKGCASHVYVCSILVSLYGKCGSIVDARTLFDEMSQQDVALWNAMLAAYAEKGQAEECLQLYKQMREEGDSPDVRTFVSLLQACGMLAEKDQDTVLDEQLTRMKSLERGKAVHAEACKRGYDSDTFVTNTTVSVYGKCGSIADARVVFDGLSQRTVVSWNAMLVTYAQHRQGEEVLQVYERMQEELVSADVQTFVTVLQACGICAEEKHSMSKLSTKVQLLQKGKAIHAEAQRKGYDVHLFPGSTLVRMYSKCGSILDAQNVFHVLPQRDVVLWNAMLAAYSEHGQGKRALESYEQMLEEGATPNLLTIVTALQACGLLAEDEGGVQVDGQSIKVRALQKLRALCAAAQEKTYEADDFVGSTLVGIYGKCGSIRDAENTFHGLSHQSVLSWNVMLATYAEQGEAEKALQLYEQMLEEAISADSETFVCILQVCGMLANKEVVAGGGPSKVTSLEKGKSLHAEAWRKGYKSDAFVGSTLITMYGRCGAIWDAENVFRDGFYRGSVVSWNVMLAALVQHGEGENALHLYREMQQEGFSPDEMTLVCILQACSSTGNLDTVREIHDTVVATANHISSFLASALISAYGKCASMVDAQRVFDELPHSDGVSWNALIAGYAREGNYFASLQCYDTMRLEGMTPDRVTFLSLISACSHAGLVDKGVECFESMCKDYGITPGIEHYVCMVDLFGRAGYFTRVEDLLLTMPMQPNLALWLCLLGACRKHGNLVLGEMAFNGAVHSEPMHAAAYVLMSAIYSDAGLMDKAGSVKDLRNTECAWKKPGQSWIQHEQDVNTFLAGTCRNPQYKPLSDLLEKVRLEAYTT